MSLYNDMAAVLARNPNLTRIGFENPCACGFTERRAEMLHPVTLDEFDRSVGWLAFVPKAKRCAADSYFAKHVCENWVGVYISNGALIAAAVHSGFTVERSTESVNADLNLSSPRYWPLGADHTFDWIREKYRNRFGERAA
jgi:hypothetical protein